MSAIPTYAWSHTTLPNPANPQITQPYQSPSLPVPNPTHPQPTQSYQSFNHPTLPYQPPTYPILPFPNLPYPILAIQTLPTLSKSHATPLPNPLSKPPMSKHFTSSIPNPLPIQPPLSVYPPLRYRLPLVCGLQLPFVTHTNCSKQSTNVFPAVHCVSARTTQLNPFIQ